MRRAGSLVVAASVALALAAACDGTFAFDQHADASLGPCASDSDCPIASLHCEVASGVCVPCVDDTACTTAGYPRCDTALHLCVECGSSRDCPGSGATCTETHRCAQSCLTSSECPAPSPYCDLTELVCAACTSGAPCASGVCDHESGRCVDCISDAQCPGSYCQRALGKCVDCVLSSQCPASAPVCDPASWTCIL